MLKGAFFSPIHHSLLTSQRPLLLSPLELYSTVNTVGLEHSCNLFLSPPCMPVSARGPPRPPPLHADIHLQTAAPKTSTYLSHIPVKMCPYIRGECWEIISQLILNLLLCCRLDHVSHVSGTGCKITESPRETSGSMRNSVRLVWSFTCQ